MTTTGSMHHNPALLARDSPAATAVLRVGWFAKGLVYSLAGVLAIVVWNSYAPEQQGEASPTGAVAEVRDVPGGALLVGVLAAGLLTYSIWRLLSAAMPGTGDAESWLHRIGYVVSAVLYAVLGYGAARLSLESSSTDTDGNRQVTDITGRLMERPLGRWVIGVVGAIVVGVGIYRVVKGVRRDVTDELDLSAIPGTRRRAVMWLGAAGEVGRGLGISLVGVFLLRSAWTYDPEEATGLDGALRRVLAHSWGGPIVVAVGIGFLAYGGFCLITFQHQRLERN